MLNIQGLMKQAQVMQKRMQEEQEKLANTEVTGSAANGLLSITLNGKSEMKKISIDKTLVSADDVEMLEDLVKAAVNDAVNQISDKKNSTMGSLGGLGGLM